MAWERVRHWQWIVLSVMLGLTVAAVRRGATDDAIRGLGESLNGQQKFEEAVLREVAGGHRQFEQLVVTPEQIEDPQGRAGAPRQLVYVVRGLYWDGRRERSASGGAERAEWRPAFYVAAVPYRVKTDLSLAGPQGAESMTRLAGMERPTVLDFLAAASRTNGVSYSYAWYAGSAYAGPVWVGACVLVFGIIIPVVINYTVYGTWWRPRRVKEAAADLSASPAVAGEKKPLVTDEDLAAVAAMNERMGEGVPAMASAPAAEKAVPVLSGGPLESKAAREAREAKAFGAEKDDFYPTERHGRH
jgi:hypothetical protein